MTSGKTKKWLLVALGFIVLSAATALLVKNKSAGWEKIGAAPGLTYYADRSSVTRADNKVTIWLLADNKEAQTDNGKSYISSRQQFEIDCAGKRKSLVHYALYAESMGKGSEVAAYDLPNHAWSPATPGTVAETMWQLSCKPWWEFWS